MSDQLRFGLGLGLGDKELGADRALAAKASWASEARRWVAGLPAGVRFTADDLIECCGTPTEVGVNANNAIGALFLACQSGRLIRSVDRAPSRRRSNHGRWIAVWERTAR